MDASAVLRESVSTTEAILGEHIVVLCTCPDLETARSLAQQLVQDRLVACANILSGVESVFWWDGKVTSEEERLVVMKTTKASWEALSVRIQSLHPYELPEIIAVPIEAGSAPYLDWITDSVATGRF